MTAKYQRVTQGQHCPLLLRGLHLRLLHGATLTSPESKLLAWKPTTAYRQKIYSNGLRLSIHFGTEYQYFPALARESGISTTLRLLPDSTSWFLVPRIFWSDVRLCES